MPKGISVEYSASRITIVNKHIEILSTQMVGTRKSAYSNGIPKFEY